MVNDIFSQFPQLETQNLILREIQLSDAENVFRIFADPDVTKYQDVENLTSLNQIKFLIERRAERFKNRQSIRWGIALKETNIIIGSCGYTQKQLNSAEVGYELAKPYWRKGIMTEALIAIINFGFQNMDLNRIEALVMLDNIASINLLKKMGFIEEGLLREYGFWKGGFHDLKIFSLLKSDYSGST